MITKDRIAVIGAGLAGCETAWQLASRNIGIDLFEMRPKVMTPAHKTGNFAELVCSNSFKSVDLTNAHGLLKAEMELAGSLIIHNAKKNAVSAGAALAVDRVAFSEAVERRLRDCAAITIKNIEVKQLAELIETYKFIVIACGPLISDSLAKDLAESIGEAELYFYDSIAPILYANSIDMNIAFKASRYQKGEGDYINCPFNKNEYEAFVEDLKNAEKIPIRKFEKEKVFEGCLPIELLAERGMETLSFGPLKPVGLIDPRTGSQPWAVLQLRSESNNGNLYNMVGCQTRMTWKEQIRVFRKVPGLSQCEFARMGGMHRNTYLNAPRLLRSDMELKNRKGVYAAGQLTGVEGYAESAASGIWVAMNLWAKITEKPPPPVDSQTMTGGLIGYLQTASQDDFQPMNANFGLLSDQPKKMAKNKSIKRQRLSQRALERWKLILDALEWHNE